MTKFKLIWKFQYIYTNMLNMLWKKSFIGTTNILNPELIFLTSVAPLKPSYNDMKFISKKHSYNKETADQAQMSLLFCVNCILIQLTLSIQSVFFITYILCSHFSYKLFQWARILFLEQIRIGLCAVQYMFDTIFVLNIRFLRNLRNHY